jgi:phosphoglycerol transferase
MKAQATIGNSMIAKYLQTHYLLIGVAIVFVALLVKSTGFYPIVFSDEYRYCTFSRLLPLADSDAPGYIYLAIYRLTNLCGDGFLDCARLLNTLFFVASTPFLYLTARRVCTRGVASAVALLAILGPINTYTVYYMPESLHFFGFWLFTWFVLQLDSSSRSRAWCLAGILLGLLALIKPNAILFLPAIVGYVLYINRKQEGKWVLAAFGNASILVALAFFTKFFISYLFAGRAGLTLFGCAYAYALMATSAASQLQHCLGLLTSSLQSVKGHALGICLLFAVPIAVAMRASCNSLFCKKETNADQRISFYALALLTNLILVACLFTASIANSGPYETNARIHMRYYNFAFPLLLIIAGAQLSMPSIAATRKWRILVALPIGLAIIYAVCTRLAPYTPFYIDSPELRGFTAQSTVFSILSILSFFALALWVYSTRAGASVFVYAFMPLAVLFSGVYVDRDIRFRLVPDVFDKAGICTRMYLSKEDASKVVVVGSELAGLYKSLFHLDNPKATLQVISKGGECDGAKLPADKEWVLVVGDHLPLKNTLVELPMNGFTLARLRRTSAVIDFKHSTWPGIIAKARGLSYAEPWGTWSSGAVVTLQWVEPLPEKFAVRLVAQAFGPNVGKEFVAHVGDKAIRFTLGASAEARVLEFSNPKGCGTIEIDVPSPVSQKELGLGGDERKLGIGFTELRITPL